LSWAFCFSGYFLFRCDESDGPLLWFEWRHQLADRGEDAGDGVVMGGELLLDSCLEFIQALGELFEYSSLASGHGLAFCLLPTPIVLSDGVLAREILIKLLYSPMALK